MYRLPRIAKPMEFKLFKLLPDIYVEPLTSQFSGSVPVPAHSYYSQVYAIAHSRYIITLLVGLISIQNQVRLC
jgi:hypothetical protein